MTAVLPGPTDFSRYDSAPLLCELSCLADHVLTTSSMFYLSILSLYLFCRQPNPPNIPRNLKTLKLYGLQCGIVPIQESWWLAPLLLLIPLLLALCLGLPALLLHLTRPMSAIPGGELCLTEAADTETQRMTFQTSVSILGYCLPLAIIICLVIGHCIIYKLFKSEALCRSECQALCLLLLHHLRLFVLQGGAPALPADSTHHCGPPPPLHPGPGRKPYHGNIGNQLERNIELTF